MAAPRTVIRPAGRSDVPAIERIVHEAYADYIERMGKAPGPMLDDYLARVGEDAVWVLVAAAKVAGILVLLARPDHLLLDNIAVSPEQQGKGLGRAFWPSPRRRRSGAATARSASTRM